MPKLVGELRNKRSASSRTMTMRCGVGVSQGRGMLAANHRIVHAAHFLHTRVLDRSVVALLDSLVAARDLHDCDEHVL